MKTPRTCKQCVSEDKGIPEKGICSCPTTSDRGYKAPWVPMTMNKEFWTEVLVGRTVTSLTFDEKGVDHMTLDDGQVVYFDKTGSLGRIYIRD